MSFDYNFCRVFVQKLKECIFCWYIYVFSVKTRSAGYSDHIAVVCISTSPLIDTKFPLPQHSKHQKTEQNHGSVDNSELDLNQDLN